MDELKEIPRTVGHRNPDGPVGKDGEWPGDSGCMRALPGAWIDGVMGELRACVQSAPSADVPARTAPGGG